MLRAAHDNELREHLPEASAALRASDPRFARWVGGAGAWRAQGGALHPAVGLKVFLSKVQTKRCIVLHLALECYCLLKQCGCCE